MAGASGADQTSASKRSHAEIAQRVVRAARKHSAAKQAGQDTTATEQELRECLDEAAAPVARQSAEFLEAAKQTIESERPEAELRMVLAPPPPPNGPVWQNWGQDQTVRPRAIEKPTSLEALCDIVRGATQRKERVRCVGPGHSYSDITETTGVLIDLTDLVQVERPEPGTALGGLLPREDALWKNPRPNESRVRIICGARISEVNAALHQAGLAFSNLGGHVGQTVLGAMATSTHGSGLKMPPLCDGILSLDLVTTGGQVKRIEPDDGITDKAKYDAKYQGTRELISSTRTFDAVRASLGCMGIVYAATVKVEPAYLLTDIRTKTNWSVLKQQLAADLEGYVGKSRHYQFLINPYTTGGDPQCIEMRREYALPGTPLRPRGWLADFETYAGAELAGDFTVWMINVLGESEVERVVGSAFGSQKFDPVVDQSYRVFDNGYSTHFTPDENGVSKRIPAISADLSFPLSKTVEAVDALLALIKANAAARPALLQASPISVRFTAKSDCSMSMMNSGPTVSIECPILRGIWHLADTLLSYERTLCQPVANPLQGRPHWGQRQELTGDKEWLAARYPRFDEWLGVFQALNSQGIFDNHFTDRLGISVGGAA